MSLSAQKSLTDPVPPAVAAPAPSLASPPVREHSSHTSALADAASGRGNLSDASPKRGAGCAALITAFVNARLNRATRRTHFIDTFAPGVLYCDADVRAVDEHGVTIFRLGSHEQFIPWAEVHGVQVRCEDHDAAYERRVKNLATVGRVSRVERAR